MRTDPTGATGTPPVGSLYPVEIELKSDVIKIRVSTHKIVPIRSVADAHKFLNENWLQANDAAMIRARRLISGAIEGTCSPKAAMEAFLKVALEREAVVSAADDIGTQTMETIFHKHG